MLAATLVLFMLSSGTADKEAALGKAWAAEIDQQFTVIKDPAMLAYVARVARELAPITPVTIKLLDTPEPIANALPGEYLIVSTGLIRRANSERDAVLAIAHALGHLSVAPGAKVFTGGPTGLCLRGDSHADAATEALAGRAAPAVNAGMSDSEEFLRLRKQLAPPRRIPTLRRE